MNPSTKILTEREDYSRQRLDKLGKVISSLDEPKSYPDLTIIGAGSFARLEASEFSDIDLFFLCSGEKEKVEDSRTKEIRLFSKMIEVIEQEEFPPFSNDCQFLEVLYVKDILNNLGSPLDDHANYFTARMLLLLESKCLFGEKQYDEIIEQIVDSYFGDYPDHRQKFEPTFLLNDICRYWKTILLNYENKRDIKNDDGERKIKQKVRNFKLKFSRMTTCFATIAVIGSFNRPVTKDQIIDLVKSTPRERLNKVAEILPSTKEEVEKVLGEYSWFIEKTGLSTEELYRNFDDKDKLTDMFKRANEYGDLMFELLKKIDSCNTGNNSLIRYLVI